MSVPSAELETKSSGLSAAGLVGIAAGLMLLSVLVAVFIATRGGSIDGAAQVDAHFGTHALPFDLALRSAREMPGGERMVVFENPSTRPRSAPLVVDDATREMGAVQLDWTKIAIPEATTAPNRVVFVFLTADASQAHFDAFFSNEKWRRVSELGAEGGLVALDTDAISWRGHDASFVHERAFEEGFTFHDVMRVDVSIDVRVDGRIAKMPCVMWAAWPPGEPASRQVFGEILAALVVK